MKKDNSNTAKTPSELRTEDLDLNPHLFKQLLNASGVAMAIRDATLRPIFANQAFVDFYGYSIEDYQVMPPEDLLTKETYDLYINTIKPTVLSGNSWDGEYTIRTKGDRLCAVWGRFDPVIDDSGKVINAISIMRDASPTKRLRNALTQTERHLNFLADNTSDCLFRLRLSDGRYDYISSAVESITGYPPQDFYETPRLFERLTPEDWVETFERWWGEFLAGKTRYEYESPLTHKDGSLKWVNQRITVEKDQSGKAIAIKGIITDVTARKLAEKKYETAQNSLNFISESTKDIFFRMGVPSGKYEYISPSVEGFSGYTADEYLNNPMMVQEIIHEDWQDYFYETWGEILRGQIRPEYIFQFVHKSGEVRWGRQRIVLHKDEHGLPVAIEGIVSDITERKMTEKALKASEGKFRFLAENITDVVWTMDDAYNFTYATPSVKILWGYTTDELCTIDLDCLFTQQSLKKLQKAKGLREQLEGQGVYDHVNRMEMEQVRKDGGTIWTETAVSRIFSKDGLPTGYMGVTRDITERRQAEIKVQESENRFRTLFEDSPISLWEEDLTRLKVYFDELKAQGVTDFRKYFYDHPKELDKCATLVDVVGVNKATLDLLRAKSKEELLGNLDKVLTESSMAAFTEEMILLASGGCEYCGEITHRTLEGDIIWVVVHFTVPLEYQDTMSRVIVSLIDVTPRKRAEEALMNSEERYRVLVENAQEGVVVTLNGRSQYINEAMTDILGYSTEELRQIHPLEVVHPDDKAMALEQLDGFVSGKKKDGFASFRVITKCAEVKWLTLNVKPITWGGAEARLEILTDVTVHKKLEEELRIAHDEMESRVNKRTSQLSQANTQLQTEAKEKEKAQEHILSLTQQLIRIQEDERQRIARDLHDNVAQDLSSIVLQMETLFDGHPQTDKELYTRGEAAASILRKSIASVRDIAYGLRPPSLDQLGLAQAMENHCQDAGDRAGIDVDFYSTGIENVALDFDTEINIYRMVQQAINNIIKHANASKATVRMVKSHPDLLIRIEDNGQGFEVTKRMAEAVEEKRMGLRSMEERARLIGGSMEIQSLTGTGTRIIFKIPIANARRND